MHQFLPALALLLVAASTTAFAVKTVHRSTSTLLQAKNHKLILIRHGESQWNLDNRFTGWVDVPLSPKGVEEVKGAGQLINAEPDLLPEVCFTSMLKRAIMTSQHVLEATDRMWVPTTKAWELNERHYGGLQGLDKQETVDKHGKDQVMVWRRSFDVPPPVVDTSSEYHPANDVRYAGIDFAEEFTESLSTTCDRVVPYWEKNIVPVLKSGKTVVVAAHGNSLRALVKHLDNIGTDVIPSLNIPTGIPLVYEFDADFNVIPQKDAIAPLQGRYLGNQEDIQARIGAVVAQTK